jgi:quercetin dioxygenase-like cupin family protein
MDLPQGVRRICWEDLPTQQVFTGIHRQRADAQHMTVVRYTYAPGSDFPAHSHPEEQLVIVLAGEIEFRISGVPVTATAGSAMIIAPGLVHSARVLSDVRVDTLNVLSPRRTKDIAFQDSKQ